MNTYEKNLDLFRQTSRDFFYKIITTEQPIFKMNIEAADGQDNYIVESGDTRCFLHSIYDIDREMQEMYKDFNPDSRTVILFGVGYGHAFDYMKSNYWKIERIIIVEPSLQLFDSFLHHWDIQKLANTFKNVDFIINRGADEASISLAQFISKEINTNISVVYHYSYRALFNEYLAKINESLSKFISNFTSNVVVGNSGTYKKIVNTLSNLEHNSMHIKGLLEAMQNRPAILVSAGPSLNKNMHILEKARDKAFIIAVGSAIGILEANGITPHLRAAFSPNENEINIFNKLKDQTIPLIHTDCLYKDVLQYYKGEKFRIVEENNHISKHIYGRSNIEHTYVFTELTIANVIFEMICLAKCSELIFVGQDLAFTDKKQYGKGAWADPTVAGIEESFIKIKDIFDEDTITMRAFLNIKEVLETKINRYMPTGIKFFNATEGGLHINGTEDVKLEEKLASLPSLGHIEGIINEVIANSKVDDSDINRISQTLVEIDSEVEEIFKINQERMRKVKKLIQYSKRVKDANKVLQKYEDINTFEDRLKAIPLYGKVLQFELDNVFSTYISAYKYNGQDQLKQLDAVESILVKTCIEVQKACGVFKCMIDEFMKHVHGEETGEEKNEECV